MWSRPGQCGPRTSPVGGKICRRGICCRGVRPASEAQKPLFYWVFPVARRLLNHSREKLRAASCGIVGVLVMLLALGAASSAIDGLKSLTSPKPPPSAGQPGPTQSVRLPAEPRRRPARAQARGRAALADLAGNHERAAGGAKPVGIGQSAPISREDALKDLFSQIDADGDGKISKSEFENALGAGGTNLAQADNVFGKLDKDGDGAVCLDEMSSALKGGQRPSRPSSHASGAGRSNSSDPLLQALKGASGTHRHQCRRLDHDLADLCRRLHGDDDDAGRVAALRPRRRRPTISSNS